MGNKMNCGRSLLRDDCYYGDDAENIIIKWLKYKKNKESKDLDTYPYEFYKKRWTEIIQQICNRRDTMTSILVTFEEYAYFYGLEWKSDKAHGVNTFVSFFEEDNFSRIEDLKKTELYTELERFVELATSCANMIPVPKYFNTGRSGPFAKWDYWDLVLIQIKKWFDGKNEVEKVDALRLLFAHSTNNYTFGLRSTNMYDSIKYTQKWLNSYESWENFLEQLDLESFVDEQNEPILFWKGHSFELPLPTDTPYDYDDIRREGKIKANFNEFFKNINSMLEKRAEKLNKIV